MVLTLFKDQTIFLILVLTLYLIDRFLKRTFKLLINFESIVWRLFLRRYSYFFIQLQIIIQLEIKNNDTGFTVITCNIFRLKNISLISDVEKFFWHIVGCIFFSTTKIQLFPFPGEKKLFSATREIKRITEVLLEQKLGG